MFPPVGAESISSKDTNSSRLKLEDAVKNVLENNLTVKNAKLEIAKSNSALYKNTSQYVWKVFAEITSTQIVNPNNQTTFFSGNKISNDKLAVGVEKQFSTGTYFAAELSTVRFDSNGFEGIIGQAIPGLSNLAIPPLYTGGLGFKLSQELWKHSFGKSERNTEKILENKAKIDRDQLVFILTNIVAKVLIDYWTLAIQEAAVNSFEKLVKNAKYILGVTYNKQRIGIAESFEINLWSSVVSSLESQLEKFKLQRNSSRINLVRILGVDPKTEISGVTDLKEDLPSDVNLSKDIEFAYRKRIDIKNLQRARYGAKLSLENAEEEDAPSIKLNLYYTSRSQSLISPQYNFLDTTNGIMTNKYPEKRIEITVSHPLFGDEGVKAGIRDAKLNIDQLKEKESNLYKEIEEELKNRYEAIYSSHNSLKIAKKNLEENQKYYNGVVQKFGQGRFTTLDVKRALDDLAQSELSLIQAKVNYNINLLRYDLTRNSLFDKYGIDPDKIIDEILKLADAETK
jgi:outer membrane protein TolC